MRVRERLVHQEPMFTANSVPGARNRPIASGEIRRLRRNRMIFGVRFKRRDYFPAFQFREGAPKPIVGRLLNILRIVRPEDDWFALYWFVGANAWLDSDETPSSVMDSNEEAVIEAASHAHDRISD
jgi:hypothetical protein